MPWRICDDEFERTCWESWRGGTKIPGKTLTTSGRARFRGPSLSRKPISADRASQFDGRRCHDNYWCDIVYAITLVKLYHSLSPLRPAVHIDCQ